MLSCLVLCTMVVLSWHLLGLPPVGMVLQHGVPWRPCPTGRTLTVGGVEFVEIDSGCFVMGSAKYGRQGDWLGRACNILGLPWGDHPAPSDEMPLRWVEFTSPFWVARTELTTGQYAGFDPRLPVDISSRSELHPIAYVSWEDANEYCAWLAHRSGFPVRLPSESEWECVCRAGYGTEFCSGDDAEQLMDYAWFDANSGGELSAVGTRHPNSWGFYDLHGNLWEWCEDVFHEGYRLAPSDGSAWTEGGEDWGDGTRVRVMRGGSFRLPAEFCRSAARSAHHPSTKDTDIGFRPVFSAARR